MSVRPFSFVSFSANGLGLGIFPYADKSIVASPAIVPSLLLTRVSEMDGDGVGLELGTGVGDGVGLGTGDGDGF